MLLPKERHTLETVRCEVHGVQQQTLVCQHIVEGLIARQRVGFFWSTYSPDDPRPNAWCSECEGRVRATGGEWIEEALDAASHSKENSFKRPESKGSFSSA